MSKSGLNIFKAIHCIQKKNIYILLSIIFKQASRLEVFF